MAFHIAVLLVPNLGSLPHFQFSACNSNAVQSMIGAL